MMEHSPSRPSPSLWPLDPSALIIQAGLILATLAAISEVAANVAANMARLKLHIGFGFLSQQAGFDIAQSIISFPANATYLRAFWAALLNTILLSAVAIAGATLLGLMVALARFSTNPLLILLARAYVEAGRNIPLLLQLFFWYFAVLGVLPLPRNSLRLLGVVFLNRRGLFLPGPLVQPDWPIFAAIALLGIATAGALASQAHRHRLLSGQSSPAPWIGAAACLICVGLAGWVLRPARWDVPHIGSFNVFGGIAVIPEFVAMAIGLTIYGSAFIAELIRAGILTVAKGQTEAGLALGLSPGRIYTSIVIPQAFRVIVLPLTGQYITLMKNSSLAAAIGYPDLMMIFAGTVLNQTGQPLETMAMTMAAYLALSLTLSLIGQSLDYRMRLLAA
jgi:general L-amino acid transport system permease protein